MISFDTHSTANLPVYRLRKIQLFSKKPQHFQKTNFVRMSNFAISVTILRQIYYNLAMKNFEIQNRSDIRTVSMGK